MSDTPRIYVASLSDYNGGRLHGRWIDATQELDDIWAEINAMLAASPENFLCQGCGGALTEDRNAHAQPVSERSQRCNGPFLTNAEEWAIHDYDNFGSLANTLGEYPSIEKVHAIAAALEESDNADALVAWLEYDSDHMDRIEEFSDEFRGQFDTEADYARDFLSEQGWGKWVYGNGHGEECFACHNRSESLTPEQIEIVSSYLDYDHIAHEMQNCDIAWFVPAKPYGVFVFSG